MRGPRDAMTVGTDAMPSLPGCREHPPRGQLTIHADRGSSMTSNPAALLLADLGA